MDWWAQTDRDRAALDAAVEEHFAEPPLSEWHGDYADYVEGFLDVVRDRPDPWADVVVSTASQPFEPGSAEPPF